MKVYVEENGNINCNISQEELLRSGFSIEALVQDEEIRDRMMGYIFDGVLKVISFDTNDIINPINVNQNEDGSISVIIKLRKTKDNESSLLLQAIQNLINQSIERKKEKSKLPEGLSLEDVEKFTEWFIKTYHNEEYMAKRKAQDDLLKAFLDSVIKIANNISDEYINSSTLYKYKNVYYLYIDVNMSAKKLETLVRLMFEYAYSKDRVFSLEFLNEHADIISKENAIKELKLI